MSDNEQFPTPPKVLIVEDERLVAMDIEMQLLALGYEVVGIADTGKEALHLAATMEPDLVVMDIKLHGSMDGIAAAAELQQRRTVPVVFVTAFGSEDAVRRIQGVSQYRYVTKPCTPEDLRLAIRAALQQYGATW